MNVSITNNSVSALRSAFSFGDTNVVFSSAVKYTVGIRKSLYVDIVVKVKGFSGVNSSSCALSEGMDISSELNVRLSVEVPMLVSFSFGVVVVKMKPGLILRIWV